MRALLLLLLLLLRGAAAASKNPIGVLACDRPALLHRSLTALRQHAPPGVPLHILHNCGDEGVASVAAEHAAADARVRVHAHGSGALLTGAAERISHHTRYAVEYLLASASDDASSDDDTVLLLEEDLVVSASFHAFLTRARATYLADPTLFCVSLWSDLPPPPAHTPRRRLLTLAAAARRTDFFPGLGWMVSRGRWAGSGVLDAWPAWPAEAAEAGNVPAEALPVWDVYLRSRRVVCLHPRLPRVAHVGNAVGAGVHLLDAADMEHRVARFLATEGVLAEEAAAAAAAPLMVAATTELEVRANVAAAGAAEEAGTAYAVDATSDAAFHPAAELLGLTPRMGQEGVRGALRGVLRLEEPAVVLTVVGGGDGAGGGGQAPLLDARRVSGVAQGRVADAAVSALLAARGGGVAWRAGAPGQSCAEACAPGLCAETRAAWDGALSCRLLGAVFGVAAAAGGCGGDAGVPGVDGDSGVGGGPPPDSPGRLSCGARGGARVAPLCPCLLRRATPEAAYVGRGIAAGAAWSQERAAHLPRCGGGGGGGGSGGFSFVLTAPQMARQAVRYLESGDLLSGEVCLHQAGTLPEARGDVLARQGYAFSAVVHYEVALAALTERPPRTQLPLRKKLLRLYSAGFLPHTAAWRYARGAALLPLVEAGGGGAAADEAAAQEAFTRFLDAAAASAAEAAGSRSTEAALRNTLGVARARAGDYDGAAAALAHAACADVRCVANLAQALRGAGRCAECVAVARAMEGDGDGDAAEPASPPATAAAAVQRRIGAELGALQRYPAPLLGNVAACYAELGLDRDPHLLLQADRYFEAYAAAATAGDQQDADVLAEHGGVLLALGRPAAAAAKLARASALFPSSLQLRARQTLAAVRALTDEASAETTDAVERRLSRLCAGDGGAASPDVAAVVGEAYARLALRALNRDEAAAKEAARLAFRAVRCDAWPALHTKHNPYAVLSHVLLRTQLSLGVTPAAALCLTLAAAHGGVSTGEEVGEEAAAAAHAALRRLHPTLPPLPPRAAGRVRVVAAAALRCAVPMRDGSGGGGDALALADALVEVAAGAESLAALRALPDGGECGGGGGGGGGGGSAGFRVLDGNGVSARPEDAEDDYDKDSAFVYLCCGHEGEFQELLLSLRYLRRHYFDAQQSRFDDGFAAPAVIVFLEGAHHSVAGLRAAFRGVRDAMRIRIVELDFQEQFGDTTVQPPAGGVSLGFSLGYRHMCRFFSGAVYRHSALSHYRRMIRLDTDSYLYAPVRRSLFGAFARSRYGHIGTFRDNKIFVRGLLNATAAHFGDAFPDRLRRRNKHYVASGTWKEICYATHFTYVDLEWGRSPAYQAYVQHLEAQGGFYANRWGDACVHYLAAAGLLNDSQITRVHGLPYMHQTQAYALPEFWL